MYVLVHLAVSTHTFQGAIVSLQQDQQAFVEYLLWALTTGEGDLKNRKRTRSNPGHQVPPGARWDGRFSDLCQSGGLKMIFPCGLNVWFSYYNRSSESF